MVEAGAKPAPDLGLYKKTAPDAFDGQLHEAGTKREETEDPRFTVWAAGRIAAATS